MARLPSIAAIVAALAAALAAGACAPDGPAPEDDGGPPGRWMPAPPSPAEAASTPTGTAREIEALRDIGYLAGTVPAGDRRGVVVHVPDRAAPGLNLVVSGHAPAALLMNMEGGRVHEWRHAFEDAFPDSTVPADNPSRDFWRRVELLPGGDLLAVFEGLGLIKVDARSRLLWAYDDYVHHDVEVLDNGLVVTLVRRVRSVPEIHGGREILDDWVTVLDAGGSPVHVVSLARAFVRSGLAGLLEEREPEADDWGDVFHTNTVHVLDGALADRSPAFAAGNVLLSLRNLDRLVILDRDSEEIVWHRAGDWRMQHEPALLPNGNMLLFDNLGTPGRSRVLEFDPLSGAVAWEFREERDRAFYSATCGTAWRLPNGNTLMTASDMGRSLEVTPDRRVVWEYLSPHRAGAEGELVATLFDVVRVPADAVADWLP